MSPRAFAMAVLLVAATVAAPATGQGRATLVAAVGANMNHVPSFVGVEKGLFLKHGIDLKLKVLSTGQEMAKALQAGEIQVIGAAFSNYPVALERGIAAKGVVGLIGDRTSRYSDSPLSVWARKGTGINRIDDLAGRKVGTPIGGTADEYLGVVLKKKGIDRAKIQVLNVPPGNIVSALHGGSVDAVAIWEPFGSMIEAKIPDAVLLSRGGGHIAYFINMAVRNDFIEKNPEVVERYVIGLAEASHYTRKHPDEAAEIAARWIPGMEATVARQALRHLVFDPRITPHTIASWEENVRILTEQKKLRAMVPWQQGIDLKFVDKAMKSHPQLFADLEYQLAPAQTVTTSLPIPPPATETRPPAEFDFGRYHALIIANQAYRALPRLRTPPADARALSDILKRDYGFVNVRLLMDATRTDMVRALDDTRRTLTEKDNLLIYYAGHGYLDKDADRGYWLPVDAESETRANWLSNADVTDTVRAIRAKHVLVVVDSCYSGTLTRAIRVQPLSPPDLMRLSFKKARNVLTSGGLEPVLDVGGEGHSVFARAFLNALQQNRGVVELTRLFADIRREVMLNADQTPQYSDIRYAGHEGGDFLFVRRR